MKKIMIKTAGIMVVAVLLMAAVSKTTHTGTGAETTITPTLLAAVR